jgi:hypothetical protein
MMIKKSIIIFFSFFILFNAIIIFAKPEVIHQNQWQLNKIQAQEYLYDANDSEQKKIVITGTSLSAALIKDLLPDDTYNLAFRGQSPYDGIEIIKRKLKKPGIVLIEINGIEVEPTTSFIDSLFLPVMYSLRELIPALRERYQASISLEMILYSIKQHLCKSIVINSGNTVPVYKSETSEKKKVKTTEAKVTQPVYDIIFQQMADQFNKPPGKNTVLSLTKKLNEYKDEFKNLGIEVILFEMPIHKDLTDSIKMIHIRKIIQKIFPPNEYNYIFPDRSDKYNTTDGAHLDDASLINYTNFLTMKLKQLSKISCCLPNNRVPAPPNDRLKKVI